MKLAHEVSFHSMPRNRRCLCVILQIDIYWIYVRIILRKFVGYNDCNMGMLHVLRHVTLFLKRAYMRNITL